MALWLTAAPAAAAARPQGAVSGVATAREQASGAATAQEQASGAATAQEQASGAAPAADLAAGSRRAVWQPRYPLRAFSGPCFGWACGGVQVLDLTADLAAGEQADHGKLRLRWGDTFLRLEAGSGHRSVGLDTARWSLAYDDADRERVEAAYRGPRLRLEVAGDHRPEALGGGWLLEVRAGYRPNPDVEFRFDGVRELQAARAGLFPPRDRQRGRASVLWQRGARFDLAAGVGFGQRQDALGARADFWGADLAATWLAEPFELTARADYESLGGRFRRRTVSAALAVRARLLPRLLLEGGVEDRVELGVAEVNRTVSAGLTWHARRFRFARGSAIGEAMVRLARAAWHAGYGDARAYDLDGMRRLRERLALAGVVAAETTDLYRATVQERNVPVIEVHARQEDRRDTGERIRTLTVGVNVPWRAHAPWREDPDAVSFLRFGLGYEELRLGDLLLEVGRSYEVMMALNREVDVRLSFTIPRRSPLQLALDEHPGDRFAVAFSYAFWR